MENLTKKISVIVIILVGLLFYQNAFAACTGTSPTWTTTPDYASVSACVSGATVGDTINVSSGSATWNSTLNITKGINLIGAGSASTIITTTAHPGIAYAPPIGSADNPFRLSGFRFNKATGDNLPILQWGTKDNAPTAIGNNKLTKGRVDHCIFNATGTVNPLIWMYPGTYGVFDNNTFNAYDYAFRATDDNEGTSAGYGWKYWGWTPGTSDAVYVENNTFNFTASVDNVGTSSQGAHRWVFRYNTFNVNSSTFSFFDAHGNMNPWYSSVQVSNIYGNKFVAGNHTAQIHKQRGGQSFAFYNDWQTTGDTPVFAIQEEYADSTGPGPANNAVTGQPQHVYNSYYFNNRVNTTGTLIDTVIDDWVGSIPADNVDVWSQSDWKSDGSAGVGCGTLAQMNAITPRVTGVGFWVTNQSCTNVSGYVGANPATPISGTLYRWNGSAWVSYYTPYTYPHPLRGSITQPIQSTLFVTSTNGTVTSNPAGINCGSTCYANFDAAATVTLTALPNSGYTFTGWSSGVCSGTGTCTVSMSSAQVVTANYAATVVSPPSATYYLSVSKNRIAAGTVTASDNKINCGSTCKANYSSGKSVTLIASPNIRFKFSGWTGACSGTGTCTVIMTKAKSAKANFYRY